MPAPRLNSALIRRVNTARVFHALRNHPGSSQRGLCALTQLDASTVSSVVAKLEADRIIRRLDSNRSGQAGRPQRMLQINRDGGVLIGAAIETDSIRLIATGLDGERRGALSLQPGKTVDAALENNWLSSITERAQFKTSAGSVGLVRSLGLMSAPRLNSALIRRVNTARVFHALRNHPGSSQRGLCALTQLDASTVSSVVTKLEADRIVRRLDSNRSGQAGRPERMLQINRDGGVLIGAAIETDSIRLLATGLDGERRGALSLQPGATVDAALEHLQRGVAELVAALKLDLADVRGIGVGQHGLIDRAGHLVLAPRMGWRDVPLGARLRHLFSVPVYLENDTKAAAIAEHLFGSCQGVADFVLLHGGSGIGGALFLQGELYHGIGLGGELGHMKVFPHGRPCSCGGNGCLEAYVSEPAIQARLAENGRFLPGGATIDAVAIQRCAADPAVRAVLDDAGWVLGLAMANLINLLNPRRIVLAGSLAALSGAMLPNAQSALLENVLPAMGSAAEIKVSELGADAVALGGVGLAMEGFLPLFGKLDGRWAVRAQAAPALAP